MNADTKPRIGFIGLGLMGHGMARNLVTKGYPLTVCAHRNRKPLDDLLAAGAKDVATNADVAILRDANYVWVKVNWSKENRNEALLSRWPAIRGYPHLFVLDANGRLVHSQDTDALEAGRDYDKAKFVDFLRRFSRQSTVGS